MNETYAKSLGVKLLDQRDKTDFDFYPRAVAEQFRMNDLAAMAADRSFEVIEESLTPDGRTSYWLAYKFPLRDASGHVLVAGIGIDITDRRRAEAEHVRLVTAIKQSA